MIKISAALLALGLLTSNANAQLELQSDQDRTLYALGVAIGANIQDFSLTPDEAAIVAMGIQDAALGSEYKVDMQVYGPRIEQFANERMASAASTERAASETFLEEMAAEPGAELMASGLVFIPMTTGSGAKPAATDTVRVHYHGTLRDGTVFDSSVQRGEPASFALNSVIPCWTEGVQLMSVGAKSKLVCPPDLAYGDRATGQIPAGSALVFEVELLGIE